MESYWCTKKNSTVVEILILHYHHASGLDVIGGKMGSAAISAKWEINALAFSWQLAWVWVGSNVPTEKRE